jgi:hypothetical protein
MPLTRIEKALTMASGPAPKWFQHSPTPNKPAPPSTGTLDAADLQRYQLIIGQRENGVFMGWEVKNMSPALTAVMALFETYVNSAAYQAWSTVDIHSREMQWRLMQVDVAEAVNTKATIPPSQDNVGSGTVAPGVPDIGKLGGDLAPPTPDYVSTGDPNAPELVFGDDGDIVTVQ